MSTVSKVVQRKELDTLLQISRMAGGQQNSHVKELLLKFSFKDLKLPIDTFTYSCKSIHNFKCDSTLFQTLTNVSSHFQTVIQDHSSQQTLSNNLIIALNKRCDLANSDYLILASAVC